LLDLKAEGRRVLRIRARSKPSKDLGHVRRNGPVDSEQIREIETAMGFRVPPGKDESRDFPRLARITAGDIKKPLECGTRWLVHHGYSFRNNLA
jgi:hypothetical protein